MSDKLNWTEILKHASESLREEKRYNQADVLRDAANAFASQQAEIKRLRGMLNDLANAEGEKK